MSHAAKHAKAPPAFTGGQINTARDYVGLVDRHRAGGIRLSSLETPGRSWRKGGEVTEARRITALENSILPGAPLFMRKIRPSRLGTTRQLVYLRRLCVPGLHRRADLQRGFEAARLGDQRHVRKALTASLVDALDLMAGHRVKLDRCNMEKGKLRWRS